MKKVIVVVLTTALILSNTALREEKKVEIKEQANIAGEMHVKVSNLKMPKAISRGSTHIIKTITVEATAYTHTGNATRTGVMPKVGMIAVDPKVIPLGTKVYIENIGHAVATDTGDAIKGYKIDIFMDTKQDCIKFGRRKVKLIILN